MNLAASGCPASRAMDAAGPGRAYRKPWPRATPRSRSASCSSTRSMPSAMSVPPLLHRDVRQAGDDRLADRVALDGVDHAHVDLHEVRPQPDDVPQVRRAGGSVVEGDPDPVAKGRDRPTQRPPVVRRRVGRDLQHDPMGRSRQQAAQAGARLDHRRGDVQAEPGSRGEPPRGVDGRLEAGQLEFHPAAHRRGVGEPAVGADAVVEARQRLVADGQAGIQGHDGLEDRDGRPAWPPGRRSPRRRACGPGVRPTPRRAPRH